MSQTVPISNIIHDAQMDLQRNLQERAQSIREPLVQPEIVTEGAYNRQHDDRMRRNSLARQRMSRQQRALQSVNVVAEGVRKRTLKKRNKKSKKNNKINKKSKRRH